MSGAKVGAEECLTPQQAAKRLGLSPEAVRSTFRRIPGVIVFGEGERKTIRIPLAVLDAWVERHKVKG